MKKWSLFWQNGIQTKNQNPKNMIPVKSQVCQVPLMIAIKRLKKEEFLLLISSWLNKKMIKNQRDKISLIPYKRPKLK